MQLAKRLVLAVTLAVSSAAAFGVTTVYTSSTSFLSHVAAGSYTETFTGLTDPVSFSTGGFSYVASAPGDIYFTNGFLGTNLPDQALTITFTGAAVTALGANFYATNISDDFQPHSLTLTLSDGTVTTFAPTSLLDSYRGFTSTLAITALTISGAGTSLYPGMDNFTVGSAIAAPVPEPSTFALVGLGLMGLRFARRRAAA